MLFRSFDGTDLNPTLEDDQVIYDEALNYLDQSIADLSNPLTRDKPESDLYFGSFSEDERIELWIRVANTLKLKAHLNIGNQEEVLALVEEGNLITESTSENICVRVPIQPSFFIDSSTARAKSRTESLIHFQLYFAGFIPSGQPTWPPAFVNRSIMLPLPESTRA
mgnify:CR=1 FL=1